MESWALRWWRLTSTMRLYLREVLVARKGIWIGVVCTVGGIATLPLNGSWATLVALALLALGALQLAWEFLALRRSQEDHLLRPRPLSQLLQSGITPALEQRGYVLEHEGRHSILRNPTVDAALTAGQDVGVRIDNEVWAPPSNDGAAALRLMVLSEKLQQRQVIFEDTKVRLINDLVCTPGGQLAPVRLQPVRYTSGLWTNNVATRQLLRGSSVVFDGLQAFTQNGRICSLESSQCANGIGVSTLAFDPLGAVYFVQQGHRNAQSPGRLAPSGSGSADWPDLDGTERPSLVDFVKRVAEREAREELGLSVGFAVETRVIGFGRWVGRGGKPEFFCLTHLSQPVPSGRLTPDERIFTHRGGAEVFPLPLTRADASLAIQELLVERRETLSVPLYWCLSAMQDRLQQSGDDLLNRVYGS